MENELCTVTLADGTVLDNLDTNGSYYISKIEIPASVFYANCTPLAASGGEFGGAHPHAELVDYKAQGGVTKFAFRDIPADKLAMMKVEADLDFLAMMTDVEF